VGLVAELYASEIPFVSLLAGLWSAKTLTRTLTALTRLFSTGDVYTIIRY